MAESPSLEALMGELGLALTREAVADAEGIFFDRFAHGLLLFY